MISPSMIYLITRCDSIRLFFFVGFIMSLLSLCIPLVRILVGWEVGDDKDMQRGKKSLKITLPVMAVFALLAALTPTTKEAVAMVSIPAIANSYFVRHEIPEAVRKLWKKYIEPEENKE